jgi:hypothetical protein
METINIPRKESLPNNDGLLVVGIDVVLWECYKYYCISYYLGTPNEPLLVNLQRIIFDD